MGRIYCSIDIETNGLAPGLYSMISLGCAMIDMESGEIVAGRKWNIRPLDDLQICPDTMKWWEQFPDAYRRATELARLAGPAMREFSEWVIATAGPNPVGAAWKPAFDLGFVRYYLYRFVGGDVFGRSGSGLDIKTLSAIAQNIPFSENQIGKIPEWLKGSASPHNHDALDDALEQAHVMYNSVKKLGVRL